VTPDRLRELRRQRALVADQLARLDREIAAATDSPPGGAAPPATASPTEPETAFPATLDATAVDPTAVRNDTRRGCFLYFAAALLALGLALAAVYYFFYRDRSLLFPSDRQPATAHPAPPKSP